MTYIFKPCLTIETVDGGLATFERVVDNHLRAIASTRPYAAGTNGTVNPDSLFPDLLPYYALGNRRLIPTSLILTGTNPHSGKSIEVFFRTIPSLDLQSDLLSGWDYKGEMVYWKVDAQPNKRVRIPFGETDLPIHLVANLGSGELYQKR